jgi:putative transposase
MRIRSSRACSTRFSRRRGSIPGSFRKECLDKFLVVGERHLDHLVRNFVAHYHDERPHQAKANQPLSAKEGEKVQRVPITEVLCSERLGGVLKHYRRTAA